MTQPTIERKQSLKPRMRFTPYAWAKLLFMCHSRDTEVSGMGIGALDDPLTIEDILIIKQQCSGAFTKFDPEDYALRIVELCDPEGPHKFSPQRCQRVWIHTHPAGIGSPSMTDDQTFDEAFGVADWAVMFIYSKSKDVYCQLRVTTRNAGGLSTELRQEIPVDIAWDRVFAAADPAKWRAELDAAITPDVVLYAPPAPLSAIGVMPTVRGGVVRPYVPPPPTSVSRPETSMGGQQPRGQAGRPVKSRLVPSNSSFLSGLSSQQLTRLLDSDISKESLFTGGIMQKLQKNGWELMDLGPDEVYTNDIYSESSSVYFQHKTFPGRRFGNRDLALVDRLAIVANKPPESITALSTAEFDLQAVAEDRVLGEPGQHDSYGFPLEAVFPWHVPGRALLFISLNEMEELLLTLEDKDQADKLTQPDGVLTDQRSIRAYMSASWEKLCNMGVTRETACREILKGLKLQKPQLCAPQFQDVLGRWIVQEVYGAGTNSAGTDDADVPPDTRGEETQVIDFQTPLPTESERLTKLKGVFREILTQAKSDGLTVQDIDHTFSELYAVALRDKWVDEFIILLQHVRDNGYDPLCFEKQIEISQRTLELLEDNGGL